MKEKRNNHKHHNIFGGSNRAYPYGDTNNTTIRAEYYIGDKATKHKEKNIKKKNMRKKIERNKKILEYYFESNPTYQEIGNKFGITRQRVERIFNSMVEDGLITKVGKNKRRVVYKKR